MQFVAAAMDSPGGSPPCQGWETMDDDSLGEIARTSDFLAAARLGASCTNYFKTVCKQAWEKVVLVGLPCVLEEKVIQWDFSPPQHGRSCILMPLELPTLRGSCILSDEKVWVGANGDSLAYLRPDTTIILHNVHSSVAVPIDPLSRIGIGLPDWQGLNRYDDATMRLKKIAIADPPTKHRSYDDYYLITVFDIRIAINKNGPDGSGWHMLAAADLFPNKFEDVVCHVGCIFVVTSQGTFFIWVPSYGTTHPPIKIRLPILDVLDYVHPPFGLTWNLVVDFGKLGSTILAVVTHGTIDVQQGATIYHDRTLTMHPDLRCHVYQMDGSEFDPRDAMWEPRDTLGEYLLFIGDNYPIAKQMPPSMHDTEGLPFMKHGCVFSVPHRLNMLGHAIPDLCRFSLDQSPSCGTGLESCDNDSCCPPLWIVPSIKNTWDWNLEDDMEPIYNV